MTNQSLLVAVGMGVVSDFLGLSSTTGAFAAGVLLAESGYRAQIEVSEILFHRRLCLAVFSNCTILFSIIGGYPAIRGHPARSFLHHSRLCTRSSNCHTLLANTSCWHRIVSHNQIYRNFLWRWCSGSVEGRFCSRGPPPRRRRRIRLRGVQSGCQK